MVRPLVATEVWEADLTWTPDGFQSGIQLTVDGDRFVAVGPGATPPDRRFTGHAILPGFVNAHSHAFQRGLRGLGETFPDRAGSFWTWRDAMYALVDSMDAIRLRHVCRQAFQEMLAAGITTVGEFHYLHHPPDTASYAYDDVVLAAADDAGIRIVLLNAYYRTGAIGTPLGRAQRRFETATLDRYWEQLDAVAERADPLRHHLGVVAHSIRAVSLDDIAALHAGAVERNLPFHMHVEEQPREIKESLAAYGRTPMRAILDAVDGPLRLVGVHCTHSDPTDLQQMLERGGSVCVCPLTEANLGDGIPALTGVAPLSLGTDSNARISMFEEMRWIEYGQRWRYQTRGALTDRSGNNANRLIDIATAGGADALGLLTGRLAAGYLADAVTVDLAAPALADTDAERLGAALVFGAGQEVIADVCVAGRWMSPRR